VGGHGVTGWPVHVFLRGHRIVENGTYQGAPGTGQWLHRATIGTEPRDITGRPI